MEQYIIANCTDVGVARQVNEDSMVTFDSPNGRVVAVCDGMGGQAAGDLASQLACSIIRDILENNTFNTPSEAITTAIMAANQAILHRASQNPELSGMGATCVMVIVRDGIVYYGWVGDSRIYYVANHIIRQISKDQSYVQQLVDCGELTPEEAEHHPQKNEILNALGVPGMTPPVIGTPLRPEPGSVVLLCSDGLSGMVDNTHIERTVSNKALTLHDRAAKLVAQANANGGLDNITVQLIEFNGPGACAPMSAGSKTQKLPLTLIAGIITALIAAAISFWVIFGTNDGKKASDKKDIKTEDSRTPGKNPGTTVKKTAPKTEKTVEIIEVNETKKTGPARSKKAPDPQSAVKSVPGQRNMGGGQEGSKPAEKGSSEEPPLVDYKGEKNYQ